MQICFSKYHGLGNDFIILCRAETKDISFSSLAKKLCQRHIGIGSDGLIVATLTEKPPSMQFFNPDGSEAEMCGNGLRCFIHYLYNKNLVQKKENILVKTKSNNIAGFIIGGDSNCLQVKVNMGKPNFELENLPFTEKRGNIIKYPLQIDNETHLINLISTGPPHAVIFLNSLDNVNPRHLGPKIENHSLFPQRINVNFARITNQETVELITWERGAGLTAACGTGACATVAAAMREGLMKSPAKVKMTGGELIIHWDGENNIYLEGPSQFVFSGQFPYKEVKSNV